MDNISDEQRKAQQDAGKDDLIQYVEELASTEEYPPGDAWISLTDAARVTRTSEAMARRWVTSGRLKVKKDPVGVPPRTRLVRLSDVAQIRPIVDPTAAITGEVRKLDLASIPRQQLQIMEDHQQLLLAIAALRSGVDEFSAEIRDRLRHELDELEKRLNSRQDRVSAALEQQFTEIEKSLRTLVNDLAEQLSRQDQEQQHRLQEASARLQDASEHLELAQKEQQKHIDNLYREKDVMLALHVHDTDAIRLDLTTEMQAREQLGRDLVTAEQRQQRALEERALELQRLLEQQGGQLQVQLETLERDQARDVSMLTAQADALEGRLEQMDTAIRSVKAVAEGGQRRMDTLQQELEQEREARSALTRQLETEQKEREILAQRLQVLVQSLNEQHTAQGEKPAGKQKKV
jgi:chromosome segregation ATPase